MQVNKFNMRKNVIHTIGQVSTFHCFYHLPWKTLWRSGPEGWVAFQRVRGSLQGNQSCVQTPLAENAEKFLLPFSVQISSLSRQPGDGRHCFITLMFLTWQNKISQS